MRKLLVVMGGMGLVAASALVVGAAAEAVESSTEAFFFTGDEQTYTVPASVLAVRVVACGAQGADGTFYDPGAVGGRGGRVEAVVAVTPGEILTVVVGGAGGAGTGTNAGYNGGGNGGLFGGGGASDVRQGGGALADRVVVGGGGGGAGVDVAGFSGSAGGHGGGLVGGGGGGGAPGLGGTQTSGGTGGSVGGQVATDGTLGTGGDGAGLGSGGGGGGFYGGGGGAGDLVSGNFIHGPGGGGSGLGDTFTPDSCAGDGQVTITALDATTPPGVSLVTPADGATYAQDQQVIVDYACTNEGSGVASCVGDLPDGSLLDTSNPGSFSFTVVATSDVGTTTTVTHSYTVHPTPVLQPGVVTVAEGDAGTMIAEVPVTLSLPSVVPVSADWTTIDFYAKAPADYVAASGTVDFAPGETSQTVPVTINADLLDEFNEALFVGFGNPTNATIGGFFGLGGVIITDDDDPPVAAPGLAFVDEGNSGTRTLRVPIELSAPSGRLVTVDWRTLDFTAVSPGDYLSASGTVRFNPGETTRTVSITVNGDSVVEPDEWIFVSFRNPIGAIVGGFAGIGFGGIVNDD